MDKYFTFIALAALRCIVPIGVSVAVPTIKTVTTNQKLNERKLVVQKIRLVGVNKNIASLAMTLCHQCGTREKQWR